MLQTLHDVGLDYLKLGQASPTLSGGEAQRIKLSSELSKRSTGHTIYLLDEPTTGLHFEDIRKLLLVLGRLVDQGNTVLVIEHNLDVIKTADWLIDMGPEGGKRGGTLVAAGTPEDVAADPTSYTGQFLAPLLEGRSRTTKASRRRTGSRPARPPETASKAPAKKTAAAGGRATKRQASARASAAARGSAGEGSSASSQRTPSKRKAAS